MRVAAFHGGRAVNGRAISRKFDAHRCPLDAGDCPLTYNTTGRQQEGERPTDAPQPAEDLLADPNFVEAACSVQPGVVPGCFREKGGFGLQEYGPGGGRGGEVRVFVVDGRECSCGEESGDGDDGESHGGVTRGRRGWSQEWPDAGSGH